MEDLALRQEKIQQIGDAAVFDRELAIDVSFSEPEFGVRKHTPLRRHASKSHGNGRTAAVPENPCVASGRCELK